MVAPIDARAPLEADGETLTLTMNMRTLALAKAAGVNFFRMKATDELDPFDMAAIVRAFAAPAHPKLSEDEAFAIVVRHADAVGEALKSLSEHFAAAAKGGDSARPRKTRQTR